MTNDATISAQAGNVLAGLVISLTAGLALGLIALNSVVGQVVLISDDEFQSWLVALGAAVVANAGT